MSEEGLKHRRATPRGRRSSSAGSTREGARRGLALQTERLAHRTFGRTSPVYGEGSEDSTREHEQGGEGTRVSERKETGAGREKTVGARREITCQQRSRRSIGPEGRHRSERKRAKKGKALEGERTRVGARERNTAIRRRCGLEGIRDRRSPRREQQTARDSRFECSETTAGGVSAPPVSA